MKPGEFVVNGFHFYAKSIEVAIGNKTVHLHPGDPDFPAAVAALQSLVRPSLDPRSGRVMAMREAGAPVGRWTFVERQGWTRQS